MVMAAVGIGGTVLQAIQWILDHPQEVGAATKAVTDTIKRVINVWDAYQAGTKTHAELLEEWRMDGIEIGAIEQHWLKKHPLDPPV